MSDAHLTQLPFESLDIPESVKRGIADLGYIRCTPIQAQTLPVALAGRDVAGQAQTGTRETAPLLLALFHPLASSPPTACPPTPLPRTGRATRPAPSSSRRRANLRFRFTPTRSASASTPILNSPSC